MVQNGFKNSTGGSSASHEPFGPTRRQNHFPEGNFAQGSTLFPRVSLAFGNGEQPNEPSGPMGNNGRHKEAEAPYQQELDFPFTPLLHRTGGNNDGYTPLHGDEQQLVPTCPHPGMSPVPSRVTMAGIEQLLRQQLEPITANIGTLQTTCQNLTSKYGELRDVVEGRLQRMESRMDLSETRVDKLEEVSQQLHTEILKMREFVREEVGTVLRGNTT